MSRLVREDGVIGMLVEPTGEPRGAVLVLGGSTGGMDETVAASLADAGFVSLALAYFGVSGLTGWRRFPSRRWWSEEYCGCGITPA